MMWCGSRAALAVVEKFSRPFVSAMPPPEFAPSVMIVAV
jgi:hypothetical protein